MFNINKDNKKNKKVSLGQAFKKYCFNDSVNKLDRLLKVNGIDDIVYTSEFYEKAQQLGFNLARDGKGWGLVGYLLNDSIYIDIAKVYDYTKIAGIYKEVWIETDNVEIINDNEYKVLTKFELIENNTYSVIRTQGYFNDVSEWIVIKEAIYYPTDVIPFWGFKNNALGESDIPVELEDAINTLDFFGNQLPVEWEYIKTQYIKNKIFDTAVSAKEFQSAVENGARVHEISDPDGKLGGSLSTLAGGASTLDILASQIAFLENRILKYSFKSTDLLLGKQAQQSVGETMRINQAVLEQNIKNNEYRLDQYIRFFETIKPLLAFLGIDTDISVELPLNESDNFHLQSLNMQIEVLRGQATSQLAAGIRAQPTSNTVANDDEDVTQKGA